MDFFNSPFHFRSKFTPNFPKIHSNPALESSRVPLIILDCEPQPLQLELPLSSHAALLFCTVVPFHLHPAGHVGVHRHAEFLGCLGEKTQKTQKNAARIQDVSNVLTWQKNWRTPRSQGSQTLVPHLRNETVWFWKPVTYVRRRRFTLLHSIHVR